MVVFTCGHCGESVQKPKVEKHYNTKCRNKNPNLSCMDCFKDFLGSDYEAHTKCITEEERYSGKGFTPKEKKGEKKQNAWVEMLQSVLDEQKNASGNVLRIIETISKHNNTPRKKPKFINFVKNVCGQKTNPKDIDQAWDLISVKLSELSNLNSQNKNKNEQDKTDAPKVNGSAGKEQNGGIPNGKKENGVANHDEEEDEEEAQADEDKKDIETKNGDSEEPNKKLSKKQRKEEKKRKKYEAELQSAEAPPAEVTQEEIQVPKKGKKNKNKIENGHEEGNGPVEGKDKNKKRKRQDTATTIEVIEAVNNADIENVSVKVKATKKKLKMEGELATAEADESICLHDQNVAKSENEVSENNGKFNWHAVIMSVLQKKGNELPFKRLQKKVLSEYSEYTGNEVDDRIADKFIKKLRSAPNVRVDKNRVLLLEEDE
ncbi:cell growth-regulating nucleolar protein isoform X1 [Vanessa cardui]|uniref:cell growth-regulating nucleolar protein isoform X1 n=2 Tax=Vanessa cardui TaxID=171605 RepID=UPI001F13FA8B|nr:cell growth-regulating nucleolar protein isoform X1 [Vanessa cardui]